MSSISSIKVNVLTTVYNGEKYLQETIDSVLNQTLDEIKYIIVDDGSNDQTKHILLNIKDDRVKVVTLPHSGRGLALNAGLERCNANFVAILDADDIADKNRLAYQLKVFEDNQDVDVVSSYFSINLNKFYQTEGIHDNYNYSNIGYKTFIKHNAICHSSAMIKVECLRKVAGYNVNRTELFDYDLWLRLMGIGCKFSMIEMPLVFKRIHDEQNFEKRKRLKYLLSATRCKYRAIKMTSDNFLDYIFPILTFFYGLLPTKIREWRMENISRS